MLDDATVTKALKDLPAWSRDGDAITARFKRRDWQDAIDFVNAIGAEAERRDHHPDLCITGYRFVTVRLTTHSAGAITMRDLDLAAWIDRSIEVPGA